MPQLLWRVGNFTMFLLMGCRLASGFESLRCFASLGNVAPKEAMPQLLWRQGFLRLSNLRGVKPIITVGWAQCAHGCCSLCLALVVCRAPLSRDTLPTPAKSPQQPLRLRRTSSAAPTVLRLSCLFLGLTILRGVKTIIMAGMALRAPGGCGLCLALVVCRTPSSCDTLQTPAKRPQPPVASSSYLLSRARHFTAILPKYQHKPNGNPSAWGLLVTLIATLASV